MIQDSIFRDFVDKRLLPQRGLQGAEYRLISPERGVKTLVRLVEIEGAEGFAVRLYPRFERWRARRRMAAEKILEHHDLPAPRIVECHVGSFIEGRAFVAEDLLVGKHLDRGEWNAEDAAAFAKAVAKYHNVDSPWHGPVEKPARGSFFGEFISRVGHRLSGIRRRGIAHTSRDELTEIKKWFESWKPFFSRMKRFELLHDKINPGNVVRLDQGGFALVDFETLQFGSGVKDLAQTFHDLFFNDETAVESFRQAYLDARPEAARAFLDKAYPFFHAYYHLSESATALKRKARTKKNNVVESSQRKFHRNWDFMQDIIETTRI